MDTAFSIIGKAISITKAIWNMVEAVKALEKSRSDLQSQLNVLQGILHSIKRSDSLQNPIVYAEVHAAVKNLDSILEDVFEKCADLDLHKAIQILKSFKGDDKKNLKKLLDKIEEAKHVAKIALTASTEVNLLSELDRQLILALNILQIAFSYTHVKDLQQLTAEFRDMTSAESTNGVYTKPTGELPKDIEQNSIKAEVSKQHLCISWKKSQNARKYEVRYDARKCITSTELFVAIGPERIKPWQDYAIQVRAVNNSGSSKWSFPPVYVRLNEGPPSRPSLRNIEAITQNSMKVIAQSPPTEQEVTHIYIEKKTEKTAWAGEMMEVNKQGEYTIQSIDPETEYVVRIYYKNKFDFSKSSETIPIKINSKLPSAPTDVTISRLTKTFISFTQKNFGAVHKYLVHTRNGCKEIQGSEIVSSNDTVTLPIDVPMMPGTVKLTAVANAGCVSIEIKGKNVKSEKHIATTSSIMKHGLVRKHGMKSIVSLLFDTEPSLMTFETVEVVRQRHLLLETLEIEAEPTASTQFFF